MRLVKSRVFVLSLVFFSLFLAVIIRLFQLQIIQGEEYLEEHALSIQKEREVEGTRGNIYDRNGVLLATNQLSYSIVIEDNGIYEDTEQKNQVINDTILSVIKICEQSGDLVLSDFGIYVGPDDTYQFVEEEGSRRLRFVADIFGESYTDDLTDEQKNISADDLVDYLCTDDLFGYDVDQNVLSKTDVIKILNVRYKMNLNSYKKYIPSVIAENVSDETRATIMENLDQLQGVSVEEDSIRVYSDSEYFASIIGYTGTISQEEYEQFQSEGHETYTLTDTVGKAGIEQYMDTYLQGTKGEEVIYVNNVGREIENISTTSAVAGNDVYLTIDSELQKVTYNLLEEKLAGILLSKLRNVLNYSTDYIESTDDIITPIGDVYNSFIGNEILNASHFSAYDAKPTEQAVYATFTQNKDQVMGEMLSYMQDPNGATFGALSEQNQEYARYLSSTLLVHTDGVIMLDSVNEEDPVYLQWTNTLDTNLYTYFSRAIEGNWVDTTKLQPYLSEGNEYSSSDEIFQALISYLEVRMKSDAEFDKLVYERLIRSGTITGQQISLMIYEQGILPESDTYYQRLQAGSISAYDFMTEKIRTLEITPGMLGLEPCSGSAVVTDPNSGEVLAMVSYPGYDNNRLANNMDSEYYNKLLTDWASPFYNRATQEKTAPGSTYKMVTTAAGLAEGVISTDTYIACTGEFDKITPSPKCWIHPYSHGGLEVEGAIRHSCNIYFYETGYRLGTTDDKYSSNQGTEVLNEYASMFGLSEKSGVEIPESNPEISDEDAVRSAIGQGTNNFTTSQLAKYVSTIANNGTVYQMSLLDKVVDVEGTTIVDYEPVVESEITQLSSSTWTAIRDGMEKMVTYNSVFSNLSSVATLAGKTGTAQQSTTSPNHGLFVGFSPIDNPQIALSVRMANSYYSTYSSELGRDITRYYIDKVPAEELLTGQAAQISTNVSGD